MRLYTFCNYYLSSIQQGIQSGHVLGEMVSKYLQDVNDKASDVFPIERQMVYDFCHLYKTWVVLNGGNSDDILSMYTDLGFAAAVASYPHALFREDAVSLNGAVTCVGVILPEHVYAYNDDVKKLPRNEKFEAECKALAEHMGLSDEDVQLAEIIRSYPLAK